MNKKIVISIVNNVEKENRIDHIPFHFQHEVNEAVKILRERGNNIYTASSTYPTEYGILVTKTN